MAKSSSADRFSPRFIKYSGLVSLPAIILLAAALVLAPGAAGYAQFGKNKVQYKNFGWQVLQTEHYDIYFYERERPMVLDAARLAERAYIRYSKMLNFKPHRRIPLILYASHGDFSQTNVLPGDVDEGTGGVNEFLKRRVILPFTGSWKDFEHVLTHELAHAFQIDIIWGNMTPVTNPFAFSPPLWFIEGMVEELSIDGMNANTEMWLRDASLNGYLMNLEELSFMPDLRSYRFGHSFWYFVAQRYGNKKIGEILQKTPLFGNLDRTFKSAIGATTKTLSDQWDEDVRKTYLPQIVTFQKPVDFSRQLTNHTTDGSNYNVTPALNSTGESLAFISNKSGYIDIWKASAIDGRNSEKLVEGERSPDFESFRFLYTSINWSPDDRFLTFVAKSGPEDAVYIYGLYNKKILHRYTFGLDAILSPSFSPDGKTIVFNGTVGGESNLYLVDVETGKLRQLTADKYTERDPVFSPDGKKIAFTTEYGPGTDLDRLIFSDYRIAILDLDTGEYSVLPNSFGDNISPQWSPSGNKIAYVSDRSGITNIFYHNFTDGREYQVTNILTGVAGPTDTSPCLSWSSASGRLAYSAFFNGGWDIYIINNPEGKAKPWQPDTSLTFDYETVHLKATKTRINHLREKLRAAAAESRTESRKLALSGKTAPEEKRFTENLVLKSLKAVPPLPADSLETSGSKPTEENLIRFGEPADSLRPKPRIVQTARERFLPFPDSGGSLLDLLSRAGKQGSAPLRDSLKTGGSSFDSLSGLARADTASTPADTTTSGRLLTPRDSAVAAKVDTLPSFSFDFDVPKEKIPLPDTSSFKFHKYKPKLSTDYVSGYGGYAGNIGFSGGVLVSMSDQLGNNSFLIGANIYGKIQDSDLLFQYMNLKRRTDIGFFVTQFRNLYYLASTPNNSEYYANIWRGVGLLFSRPFDRFRRIEWGLSAYSVSAKTFGLSFNPYDYYYYGYYNMNEQNVQKYGTSYFAGPEAALVYDNAAFGLSGPVDGSRYRLSAQQFFGEISYRELVGDWRKYWLFWKRITIALRGIGASRWGKNPQIFYIGGPYTFRGANYGDMIGTNVLLTNAELRFPLIDHLVLGWPLPVYLRGITGVFFYDLAGVWLQNETFQPFTTSHTKFVRLKDAQGAYGFGIRVNLGYFLLRFDTAKTLEHYVSNFYSFEDQIYRSEELVPKRHRNFFSIGYDF